MQNKYFFNVFNMGEFFQNSFILRRTEILIVQHCWWKCLNKNVLVVVMNGKQFDQIGVKE